MPSVLQFWNITPAPGACPFAQRAWIALNEKKIKYDTHLFSKAEKPKEFLQLYEAIWPDPQAVAKVPTIIDTDGTQLTESQVVVEYLESKYKYSGTQLIPDDPALAAKTRLFGEVFSAAFLSNYRKVTSATSKSELSEAQTGLLHGIGVVDAFLRTHGTGSPYLLGNQYSLAEVNSAPFVWRAKATLQAHRNYDLLAEAQSAGHKRFADWAQAVLDRPSTNETALPLQVSIESSRGMVKTIEE